MDEHERHLIAFLAGDLDPPSARGFDAHLLRCDRCWRAVREDRLGAAALARLRESAPADLTARITFAVEAAPPPRSRSLRRARLRTGVVVVVSGVLAVLGALAFLAARPPRDPPVIAAVAHAGQTLPAPVTSGRPLAAPGGPTPVGHPRTLLVGDVPLRLQRYRLGGVQLLRAMSDEPVRRPEDAAPRGEMAWSLRRGGVTLYCPRAGTLLAARVSASRLVALAAQLPPAR